jgi:23S rRNA pseudouridine2605 synthase
MRLNKFIAHSGVCSRRDAAELVKTGKISVNGTVETSPGYQIQEGDEVIYRGQVLSPAESFVYLLLNKPKGIITTTKDERGRTTVMDMLRHKIKQRIFPVGRLDRETTGLLLLTNDGDLAKRLTHPSHEVPKVYEATLDKPFTKADLDQLAAGLQLEDGPAKPKWTAFAKASDKKTVSLEITMGRNRIVRRMFEHLGYEVVKLDRVYLAGLDKKHLPRGFYRHLTELEIRTLRHFS